jgi:hypothetical protein
MADLEYHGNYQWAAGTCPESDGAFKNAGMAVVRALDDLHSNAERLAKEKFVSAEGAAQMLAPYQERVVAEAARQRRLVSIAAAELKTAEDELFSPPALEPGDAAGASDDMQRRIWYDSLNANQRDEFEAQAKAGKHPEIVLALARSPVPGRGRAFGLTSYRAEIETKKAARVRALETRRRALAWAEGVLSVAPRVAQSAPSSERPVESPIERMTRARASMKPATTA